MNIKVYDEYKSIVNVLMNNDKNSNYDEILKDNDYDLRKSIYELYSILYRLVNEEYRDFINNDIYIFYEDCLESIIKVGNKLKVFK